MTDPIRAALAGLLDEVLAADGDVAALARILRLVADLKADLAALDREVQAALFDAMPGRHRVVAGVGTLERATATKLDRFDSERLLDDVLAVAFTDPSTGEVFDPSVRARVRAVLEQVLPITPSLGWRRAGLTELGVDWRSLHSSEKGAKTVHLR